MVSKREQITTSAITFLSGKPLASMEEIAKAAGIGRATLFRYFNNRQALVDELELECKRRLNRAIAPYLSLELPADQLLYQVIKALIPLGDSLHFLFFEAFNINNPQVESAFQDDIKIWERLIVQLQEEGLINSNLSHRWIARTIDSLVYQSWEMMNSENLSHAEATQFIWRTLTQGAIRSV